MFLVFAMDWAPVLSKLRKSDHTVWHQMVQAFDNREWADGLRLSDEILKQSPHHAGLTFYLNM